MTPRNRQLLRKMVKIRISQCGLTKEHKQGRGRPRRYGSMPGHLCPGGVQSNSPVPVMPGQRTAGILS